MKNKIKYILITLVFILVANSSFADSEFCFPEGCYIDSMGESLGTYQQFYNQVQQEAIALIGNISNLSGTFNVDFGRLQAGWAGHIGTITLVNGIVTQRVCSNNRTNNFRSNFCPNGQPLTCKTYITEHSMHPAFFGSRIWENGACPSGTKYPTGECQERQSCSEYNPCTNCTNGATNYPTCTTCPTGSTMNSSNQCICTNGASNPPSCTTCPAGLSMVDNLCVCPNGAINPPTCNQCGSAAVSSATGCTCANGATTQSNCTQCPNGQVMYQNQCVPGCTLTNVCGQTSQGVIINGTCTPVDGSNINNSCIVNFRINTNNVNPHGFVDFSWSILPLRSGVRQNCGFVDLTTPTPRPIPGLQNLDPNLDRTRISNIQTTTRFCLICQFFNTTTNASLGDAVAHQWVRVIRVGEQ